MAQPPSYPNKTGYTQTMVPNSKETGNQLAMAPPAFYVLANGGMPGFNHVVPSGYNQVPIVAYLPISIRGDASGLVQSTSCSCNRSSVAISSSKPSPTELVSDNLHIVSTSTSAPDQPQHISPYTRPVSLALSDTPTFSTPNTASPDAPAFPVPEVVVSRRRSRPNPITIPPPNAELSCYSATQAHSMPPTALVYPKQQSLDIFGESNKPAQSPKALLSTKLGSPYSLLERPTNPTPGELPSMYADKQTGDISPARLESLLKSVMRIKDEEKHRRALADGLRIFCAQEEEKEKERVRKYEAEQTRLRTFYLQHNEKADSLRKAWRWDLKQLVQLANATLAEDVSFLSVPGSWVIDAQSLLNRAIPIILNPPHHRSTLVYSLNMKTMIASARRRYHPTLSFQTSRVDYLTKNPLLGTRHIIRMIRALRYSGLTLMLTMMPSLNPPFLQYP
jgi:hypothetical protein